MGFRKGDDFYIALGGAKISPKVVVNKVMQRLKQGEAAESEPTAADDLLQTSRRRDPADDVLEHQFGISVDGDRRGHAADGQVLPSGSRGRDRRLHLARPRDHDPPRRLPQRGGAESKDPERFTPVQWDGDAETAFRVEIQVDGWDRHRLLEDIIRTFAEAGINILDAHCTVSHPMVKDRFVVEVGDTRTLDQAINRLRNIDAVFDAYRVTPGS